MRFYCLLNTRSGRQEGRYVSDLLNDLIESGDHEGVVEEIDFDRIEQQVERCHNADYVLIAGGDGTISALAPYLVGHDLKVGILPLGTGNDLAKEIGVWSHFRLDTLEDLLSAYRKQHPRKISIWRLEFGDQFQFSDHFCNYVSFGYCASAVADFTKWRRKFGWLGERFGRFGNRAIYGTAALKNLMAKSLPELKIRAHSNGEVAVGPARSLLFANIRSIMGLGRSNALSDPEDDQLEALQIGSVLNYFSMLGPDSAPLPRARSIGASREWEVLDIPENVSVQLDGESLHLLGSRQFRIRLAGTVTFLVPEDKPS